MAMNCSQMNKAYPHLFDSAFPKRNPSQSGFSLVEAMVAVTISLVTLGAAMTLNAHQLKLVKSSRESNASSFLLQDRIEQFRILSWQNFTDAAYLSDNFLATRPNSASLLPNISEEVKVEAWPDATASGKILVRYENGGAPTAELTGAGLSSQRMAKVDLVVRWSGKDNRTRTRSYATIISNSGVNRTSLPAFGAPTGAPPPSSTPTPTSTPSPDTSPTPAPTATPTPAPTGNNGNGRGNAGGKNGKN